MLLNLVLMVTIWDNTFFGFDFQIGVNRNIKGNTHFPQGLLCGISPWLLKAPHYPYPYHHFYFAPPHVHRISPKFPNHCGSPWRRLANEHTQLEETC